jgi:hypothetical protein
MKKIVLVIIGLCLLPFLSAHSVDAAGELNLKWTSDAYINSRSNTNLLSIYANGDNVKDIVFAGGFSTNSGVTCLDGKDGTLLWDYRCTGKGLFFDANYRPLEAGDVDGDGKMEIVAAGYDGTVCLNAEDGSTCWFNTNVEGNEEHAVSIVYTDENGYPGETPYVFVCHPHNSAYTVHGELFKLNGIDGSIVKSIQVCYPCHGGISMGDINGDGKLEIVMTDRSYDYDHGDPDFAGQGKGVQAYDFDLNLLWYGGQKDPSFLCSSLCAMLVDVTGDASLEVLQIESDGTRLWVLDGDGAFTSFTNNNSGLYVHEQPAICDWDGDGNYEIAAANGNVRIYDLVNRTSFTLSSSSAKTGYFANVFNTAVHPEYPEYIPSYSNGNAKIFDYTKTLVITLPYALMGSVVQDIDGDGRNEFITMDSTGFVRCYDTLSETPSPPPATESNDLGNQRTRSSISFVPSTCGNGIVDIGEDCKNCPGDIGPCIPVPGFEMVYLLLGLIFVFYMKRKENKR